MDEGGDGWLTTTEAAELLGLASTTIAQSCRRGQYEAKKEAGPNGLMWVVSRAQVEAQVLERQRVAELEAQGFKVCPHCGEPKRPEDFWKGQCYCMECQKAERASPHPKRRRWQQGEVMSGSVESYVGPVKAAEPADALQYACMDAGFHHKPLPMRDGSRVSKREAYCQFCEAAHCVHYSDVTPKELVRRWKLSRGRVATGMF